jgi:branched-chain amino acid transport system ATP-binding protein
MLLEVRSIDVRYGVVEAVRGVSLSVAEGEIVAVVGANGAGKTSLLRGIQGLQKLAGGSVAWKGRPVARSAAARVRDGLVLVPEGRQVFITVSVHENLLAGAYTRRDAAAVRRDIDAVYDRFPNLAARRQMPAAVLSGGEQQMLAIGRAMLARPALMMLDEPSLGLSPLLSARVFELMAELNAEGLAILLVEQNTRQALAIARRAVVLELGRAVMQGEAGALMNDERLRQAYLGE